MRYLQYALHGFEKLSLTDNNNYYPVNNHLFKSIHLSDDVNKLTVELNDGITYDGYSDEIEVYLNQICFNMIIDSNVSLNSPHRILECINDKEENENPKKIKNFDYGHAKDEISIQRNIGANNFYKNITNKQTSINKHFVIYERIFNTLFNPIKVVQFMSLYQLLYELVNKGKEKPAQWVVTNYIKKHKSRYPFISFKPSRKDGIAQDSLSYLRNEIGHCEDTNNFELYSQLGSQITDYDIKHIITVLNDVIMELP